MSSNQTSGSLAVLEFGLLEAWHCSWVGLPFCAKEPRTSKQINHLESSVYQYQLTKHNTLNSTNTMKQEERCTFHTNLLTLQIKNTAPVFYFCSHGHESLFDIGGIFSTSFHERNPNFICKCLKR